MKVSCIPLQKCKRNLTVDSEPSFSRRFRKTTTMILTKRTRKSNFGEKIFRFVFLFRQIEPLQNT